MAASKKYLCAVAVNLPQVHEVNQHCWSMHTATVPATGSHALCKPIGGYACCCSLAGNVLGQQLRLGRAAARAIDDKRHGLDVVVAVKCIGLVDPFLVLCGNGCVQNVSAHGAALPAAG